MNTTITQVNSTQYNLTYLNNEYRVYITSDNGGMPENTPIWFIDYLEAVSDNKYIHGHPLYELHSGFNPTAIKIEDVQKAAINLLKSN